MKKNTLQLKVFLLVMVVTTIACQTVMGVPPVDEDIDDIREAGQQGSEAGETVDEAQDDSSSPLVEGQEACYENESFHPDSGLCYSDNDSVESLFIAMMEGVADYDENYEEELLDEEYVLVTYEIDGDEILYPAYESVRADLEYYQDDIAAQHNIWDLYAAMIPSDKRSFLTYYIIATDGLGGNLAAVEQDPRDPSLWMLNVDILDTNDTEELTFTLVHEFGHLLTLNSDQVEVDAYVFKNPDDDDAYYETEESCATYFTGEGCAKSSSYFYLFFDEFWYDLYDEWSEIQYIEDDDAYYETSDEFYFAHEDHFVTDYAATNPGEDIAESWAFFVTQKKPLGNTIAEEKVLFFYQFPELVSLREEIIARSYSRLIRMH